MFSLSICRIEQVLRRKSLASSRPAPPASTGGVVPCGDACIRLMGTNLWQPFFASRRSARIVVNLYGALANRGINVRCVRVLCTSAVTKWWWRSVRAWRATSRKMRLLKVQASRSIYRTGSSCTTSSGPPFAITAAQCCTACFDRDCSARRAPWTYTNDVRKMSLTIAVSTLSRWPKSYKLWASRGISCLRSERKRLRSGRIYQRTRPRHRRRAVTLGAITAQRIIQPKSLTNLVHLLSTKRRSTRSTTSISSRFLAKAHLERYCNLRVSLNIKDYR